MANNEKIIINATTKSLKEKEWLLDAVLENEDIKKAVLKKFNIEEKESNSIEDIDIEKLLKENEEYKNRATVYLYNSFDQKHKEVALELKELTDELKNKEIEKENIETKLNLTTEEYIDLIAKQEELNGKIKEVQEEFNQLEGGNRARRNKKNELENEKNKLEVSVNNFKIEIAGLEEKKRILNENINNIETFYENLKTQTLNGVTNIVKLEEDKLNLKKYALNSDIKKLTDEKTKLENSINTIKEKEDEMKNLKVTLDLQEEKLQNKEERIESLKQKIDDYETETLKLLKEEHEKEITQLKEALREKTDQYLQSEKKNRRLELLNENKVELETLNKKLQLLEIRNTQLENDLLGINDEKSRLINKLQDDKDNLNRENENLIKENSELTEDNIGLRKYRLEFEAKMVKLKEFDMNREELLELLNEKNQEISDLKTREMSEEAKKQVIEQAYFTKDELVQRKENINEIDWLKEITDKIKDVGFVFNNRLLYAFHTSLKISDWSSLSILSGVSGTGKSELPRLYSRYGGLNFISLAVQPNWDSPYSLFGYYNSLEGKFNATSLLKILYQAQEGVEDSINDYLTIVLLDEMNLAHVELYFSELLSKLETLRGKENGEILEIDIAENKPYEITLNNSIMWVGTMNEDETTKSLSDKVIDRGNLINFPKPNKLITRNSLKELKPALKLRKENWNSWKWLENKSEKLEKKLEELKEVVESINEALEGSGRAIGHRVWQSIENYIKNYPLVLGNLENEKELDKYLQIAFEDALVQKLIPKLRGLETSGDVRTKCLDKIRDIVEQRANGILKDFEIALNNPYDVFVWTSSTYLEKEI